MLLDSCYLCGLVVVEDVETMQYFMFFDCFQHRRCFIRGMVDQERSRKTMGSEMNARIKNAYAVDGV